MKILLSKTGYWRKNTFRVKTDLIESNKKIIVQKTPLGIGSEKILSEMRRNYLYFKSKVQKNVFFSKPLKNVDGKFLFEFNEGPTLEKMIEDSLIDRNFAKSSDLYFSGCKIISSLPSIKDKIKNQKKFIEFFKIESKYHNLELEFVKPALTELTADHIIISNGKYCIFDYEIFFDFPIPKDFILFRYQFHLLNTLQQVIGSLSSLNFKLEEFLKDLYIPSIWLSEYQIDIDKKNIFLNMEREKQNYLNWEKIDFDRFKNDCNNIVETRIFPRLTKQQVIESFGVNSNNKTLSQELEVKIKEVESYKIILKKIQSAKFFKVWQSYCKIRDGFLGKVNSFIGRLQTKNQRS